jgi:hypothetical protein
MVVPQWWWCFGKPSSNRQGAKSGWLLDDGPMRWRPKWPNNGHYAVATTEWLNSGRYVVATTQHQHTFFFKKI